MKRRSGIVGCERDVAELKGLVVYSGMTEVTSQALSAICSAVTTVHPHRPEPAAAVRLVALILRRVDGPPFNMHFSS